MDTLPSWGAYRNCRTACGGGGEDREGKDGKPLGPSREEAGQATIDNVPTVMNQFTLWASVSSSVECGTYCSGNGR